MNDMSGHAVVAPADADLAALDLMDTEWFVDGPPHALFERMRAEAPVRWNPVPGYAPGGFWSVTRHEDVSAISRDTATFSSHRAGIFLEPDQVTPLDLNRNLLLYKDPPEHTKYRKILQTAFVPHTVAKLEDEIRARVIRTIDQVVEQGSCDFTKDIAIPIPLGVLAQLMGLPEEDIPRLHGWSDQIEEGQLSREPAAAMPAFIEMAGYLHEQIARQAAEGTEDSLVMRMRNAEVDGERLDDNEILVFFGLLVFAGNDTTRNTTSSGLLALLEHPDQLAAMRDDPSLIPQAVEEILRWTSVVNYFARTATTDTELQGQRIAEGDKVVMWYTSASRDEDVYENPQTFDITREEHNHKAFGGGGRHFCLGAGLARLELRVIFEEVLRRMPDIAQAGPVERLPSAWANALTSLPVTFTPGARS
jgi:cholest-4-en-3-one 26-monooxygenase